MYGMPVVPAVVLVLLPALSMFCSAAEIVIVPSSDVSPYMMAKAVIEKELVSKGYTARTVLLGDLIDKKAVAIDDDTKAVVSIGSQAAVWLHKRVKPPVMLTYCMVADPEKAGVNADPPLQGISTDVPIQPQFEFISRALPKARSVGMLYRSDTAEGRDFLNQVRAGMPLGWRLEAVALDKHETVALAISELFSRDIDIVWTSPDSSIYDRATIRALLLSAIREKVPVFGYSLPFVKAGSLLGIAINPETQGRQAAALTHHLLHPQKNSDVEKLKEVNYETALNLIVAEQLSIELPRDLIQRVDHVIKP
jgi:putative ABC transport system substrate-binding protein